VSTIHYDQRIRLYVPDTVRPLNKGYGEAGASKKKRALKGFTSQSGSPREDIDLHNATMRQRGRMMYMGAPIATSAINTNRTNVIGLGLVLQSQIDREVLGMTQDAAEAWQKKTEREFALWAENKNACDATGVNDFYAMQQVALISWLASGDVLGVFKQYDPTFMEPYSLRLHLIEVDRVATPSTGGYIGLSTTTGRAKNGNRIFDGVEVDENGRIVAYHIRNAHSFEITGGMPAWARVEAYGELTGLPNMIHIMNTERPEQYRGVSYLAQVIEPLLQLRRYTESELMAAVVESFFTAFIKTETDKGEGKNPFNETGQAHSPMLPAYMRDPNDFSMGPGQTVILGTNETVEFGDPKRPANGFPTFTRAISEQIGAALELPADLLLKSFNSSYSASRAALLEAWKAFKMRREWFVGDFCRPVYSVWMAEAVARGRIQAPGFFTSPELRAAYLGSEWIGPSQGQLDPVKEITAELLACSVGFSTYSQSTTKLNGSQWAANIEQLRSENEKLAAVAGSEGTGADPKLAAALSQMLVKYLTEGDDNDYQRRDPHS